MVVITSITQLIQVRSLFYTQQHFTPTTTVISQQQGPGFKSQPHSSSMLPDYFTLELFLRFKVFKNDTNYHVHLFITIMLDMAVISESKQTCRS